jgi:ATP-dependent RNA helicase DeaD
MLTTQPFDALGLAPSLLSALTALGYEAPTPIQEQTIPILLNGDDLVAQAQTGTGKTAAFALPILSQLDLAIKEPQALIIVPTRELAIQIAEACQSYAKHMQGFHVTPIYGGQDYPTQLRALKRGTHIVVGTPGRVIDHLQRGSLAVSALKSVVLDEADQMLKMGFIEDITWILDQIPHAHQTSLFSATMPPSIQKIASRYLKQAKKVDIKPKKTTVDAIEQFYIRVTKEQKLDVLTRLLEVESIQASIIFTRTKQSSTELAEKLQARGYAAAALNGDMNQALREKVIDRIKSGALDIIVATDIAARGIDVDRISHVINFDIPCDAESYIHRIGRTGRAGRTGKALLFVTAREHGLLNDINRVIQKPIEQIQPPSVDEMHEKRNKQLAEKVMGVISKSKKLDFYRQIIEDITAQSNSTAIDIAAALVYLSQQANPLPSHNIEAPAAEARPHRKKPAFASKNRRSSKSFSSDRDSQTNHADKRSSRKPAFSSASDRHSEPNHSDKRASRKPAFSSASDHHSEASHADKRSGRKQTFSSNLKRATKPFSADKDHPSSAADTRQPRKPSFASKGKKAPTSFSKRRTSNYSTKD